MSSVRTRYPAQEDLISSGHLLEPPRAARSRSGSPSHPFHTHAASRAEDRGIPRARSPFPPPLRPPPARPSYEYSPALTFFASSPSHASSNSGGSPPALAQA